MHTPICTLIARTSTFDLIFPARHLGVRSAKRLDASVSVITDNCKNHKKKKKKPTPTADEWKILRKKILKKKPTPSSIKNNIGRRPESRYKIHRVLLLFARLNRRVKNNIMSAHRHARVPRICWRASPSLAAKRIVPAYFATVGHTTRHTSCTYRAIRKSR